MTAAPNRPTNGEAMANRSEDAPAKDGGAPPARFWRRELDRSARLQREWTGRAERRTSGRRRFNILWANTETLKPAVYSRTPAPEVRRRHLDPDPVGREAATVLERALSFAIDDHDFDGVMEAARDDMLLPGRGVARVVYEPVLGRRALERLAVDGREVFLLDGRPAEPDGFDGETAYVEEVIDQRAYCRHVYWKDYREQPVRCWQDVRWVAFRHTMTRAELVARFGETGRSIPLEAALDGIEERGAGRGRAPEDARRAVLWEVWDKNARRRVILADGHDEIVEDVPDPLGLAGFFPMPEPLYAVRTTGTRVPVPEFTLYQDQALELDELATRKRHLIAALKARGVYAGVLGEIERLLAEGGENEMIPVKDWDQFRDKGGLAAAIEWMPIERIAQVVVALNGQIGRLKAEIFEITGLSDIIRGASKASETATAQRLKGNFGALRLQPRQRPMQRFARDILRLKAEVIAEHFTPDTLRRMTGRPVTPEVAALLREERARLPHRHRDRRRNRARQRGRVPRRDHALLHRRRAADRPGAARRADVPGDVQDRRPHLQDRPPARGADRPDRRGAGPRRRRGRAGEPRRARPAGRRVRRRDRARRAQTGPGRGPRRTRAGSRRGARRGRAPPVPGRQRWRAMNGRGRNRAGSRRPGGRRAARPG